MRIIWVMTFFLMAFCGTANAENASPVWKVGRAKIEAKNDDAGQERLLLRLSLRNDGKPGKAPLEIKGRWSAKDNSKPEGLKKLGTYTREVALKQTAILVISLEPLGGVPQKNISLELVILTGSQETDRQDIPLP